MKLRAPNYAEVASTLALVITLTSGTAVAASMINGKRIVSGTIASKQIKNDGVWRRDIRAGAVGSTEIGNGTIGSHDLQSGLRTKVNASPWGKIPSRVTVKGQEYWSAASGVTFHNITLPAAAPVPLNNSQLKFAPDSFAASSPSSEDAACSGSYSRPTAPRGMVCIYLGSDGGANNITPATWADPDLRTGAFYLSVSAPSATNPWLTWAYTAP